MKTKRGRIFVFTNRKGGSGKSTHATNYALFLVKEGREVVFLDLDHSQGDGQQFFEGRKMDFPEFEKPEYHHISDPSQVERVIREAVGAGKDVVCDCAPLDPPQVLKAVDMADALVYPFQAGGNDMRSLGRALALAATRTEGAAERGITPPRFFSLINKYKAKQLNDKSLKSFLERMDPFHFLGGVGDRNEIRNSTSIFQSVWEFSPDSAGAKEMLDIFEKLHRCVGAVA